MIFTYLVGAAVPASAGYVQWAAADGGNDHYYGLVLPDAPAGNYTWSQARDAAVALSFRGAEGYLATVTSAAENQFLFNTFGNLISPDYALLGGTRGDYAWIGLTDEVNEGQYRWVTGESFSYSNWAPPEPNNLGNEDYVHYWRRDYGDGFGPRWSWNDSGNVPVGFNDTRVGFFVEFSPPFAASPAPEPSTFVLAMVGAASACGLRGLSRRRG